MNDKCNNTKRRKCVLQENNGHGVESNSTVLCYLFNLKNNPYKNSLFYFLYPKASRKALYGI